jgi:hypothetical protein
VVRACAEAALGLWLDAAEPWQRPPDYLQSVQRGSKRFGHPWLVGVTTVWGGSTVRGVAKQAAGRAPGGGGRAGIA